MSDVAILFERCRAALARTRHASYRLQLGPWLRFDDAGALAPYLSALGVSETYLSSCFKCGPGSSHGYDITDHNAFNPEIGTPQSFDRMAVALAEHDVGVILDVVPNHMGIAGDSNPWWLDVLENGPSSPYASFFESWPDGRVKLFLTHRALTCRRRHARLFSAGAYQALSAGGEHAEHLIGFARVEEPDVAVVAVPRLTARLTGFAGRLALGAGIWADTWLSLGDRSLAGAYRDRFSGQRLVTEERDGLPALAAGSLFASFPAALLEREEAPR